MGWVVLFLDFGNNRPRKCLGYKTPFEVFAELTGKDYFLN
ncbi:Mobile element protein [uncultured Gammaproteobacteria bacterium]|nr:Mobile element protein [uncultured Gammaproteobacteria bacterium]